MDVEQFVSRLENVKRRGKDKFLCSCPAHDDSDPSLAVTSTPQGKILLKCFAGCSAGEVVQAMGLKLEDLFPEEHSENPMAFAYRELKRKEHQKKREDYLVVWVAVYAAQYLRGRKPSKEEAEKFNRFKKIVREKGREEEAKQLIARENVKVMEFDTPAFNQLVERI